MRSRGFTLIETVIAMGILVFGLVSVASLFFHAAAASQDNRQRTTAVFLVRDKMEQMKSTSLSDAPWSPGTYREGLIVTADGRLLTAEPPHGAFVRSWEIRGEPSRMLTIRVYGRYGRGPNLRLLAEAATIVSPGFE